MITRHHAKGDVRSTAVYSDCERYRYRLSRVWDQTGDKLAFIMLNPSKANEIENDPTVERCERRARTLGAGGFEVTNIFAWRDTDPKRMRQASDPIGPQNDSVLRDSAAWADRIIVAWGTHGAHLGRGAAVERLLRSLGAPLYHLGLSKGGHPKHPLYIPYSQTPVPWTL